MLGLSEFAFKSNSTYPADALNILVKFMTPYVKICATILLVNINEIKKHIDGVARHVYHRVQVNTIDMVLLSFVFTHG